MVTIEDAKAVTDSITRKMKPLSVLVFGSVATKGVGEDLDILIISEDKKRNIKKSYLLLNECLKRYYGKFAIDPFVIPQSLLNEYYLKGSPFLTLLVKEGRVLYMKDAVKEWVKQCEDELDTAKYLISGGFFKGVCYHAQQAVEKAIKARLLLKGWDLEKTHSIERLIAIARDYKIRFGVSDEDVVFMDSIYRGRYPAEAGLLPFGEPTETDAKKAVAIALRILNNVQLALKH